MNREILFKAKTTKKDNPKHEFNEKWAEGNLILCGEKAYIHPISNKIRTTGEIGRIIVLHEVIHNTLCQYTGLTDKNGKRIWENDVVKCNKRKEGYDLYKVVWRKEFADFGVEPLMYKAQYPIGFTLGRALRGYDYKVIGNIFDNADLLEVE